jgi:hypothetical protein
MTDLFPHEEFDDWAESYDASVSNDQFPFTLVSGKLKSSSDECWMVEP